MCGLFETYSETVENSKKKNSVLLIKGSFNSLSKVIVDYLNKNNFTNLNIEKTYFEIFAIKDEIEYTINVVPDGSTSVISLSTFCEKKGKSRKALIKFRNELKSLLEH